MSDETDGALVGRHLAGDPDAFAILVRRHERRIYNLSLRMLGRQEDALDATQDTFLAALRKLSRFRGEAAFSTWLHCIAVNRCYDILRARSRQPSLHPAGDVDSAESELGPAVEDHADDTVARLDAASALMRVAPEFRAVLALHDIHDLGFDEIASILAIPIGTVKSRVHRGRVALARAMGPAVGEPGAGASTSDRNP